MKPKILLEMESATEELTMMTKNIPLISTSSRRGSEDTTYHRTRGETSFIEGIDEHTPLITKEN